jgi:hypothetical protein
MDDGLFRRYALIRWADVGARSRGVLNVIVPRAAVSASIAVTSTSIYLGRTNRIQDESGRSYALARVGRKGQAVEKVAVLKQELDLARRIDMLNCYVLVAENTYSGPLVVTLASSWGRGVQLFV